MRKNLSVLLALGAILAATLACNLGAAEMSLENVRAAFDSDGNTPTEIFTPADVFFVVADLKNAPAGTVAEARWIAVQIEGYDPGELIYEQAINDFADESYSGTIYFQLSNDAGWQVGEYRVDMYLDGTFVQTAAFSVRE